LKGSVEVVLARKMQTRTEDNTKLVGERLHHVQENKKEKGRDIKSRRKIITWCGDLELACEGGKCGGQAATLRTWNK